METDTERGPGARRRYLGKVLRGLREDLGLKTAEVAKQMHASQPTLTRIEGGRGTIMVRHVYRLLEIYGVEGTRAEALMSLAEAASERGWWESYSDVLNDWFEIYASLESDAEEIWTYEAEFVPGLFQTADYVQAVRLSAHPESTPDQVHRSVQLRMERQQQRRDQKISAVVNESVVRRRVGGPGVMREQIRRLIDEIEGGVDLRIVTFESGAHPAMTGSFSMLRFPDTVEMDVVYTESERGAMYLEKSADLLRHGDVFGRLREQALSPQDTAAWLTRLMAGEPGQTEGVR